MRRSWVAAAALLVATAPPGLVDQSRAAADESRPGEGGAGYNCSWGFQRSLPGGRGIQAGRSSQSQPRVVYVEDSVRGPDGKMCLRLRAVPIPGDSPFRPGTNLGGSGPILNPYPPCPGSPAVPAIDPRVLAVQGWEKIDLPEPRPYIAPGWALTGKLAYLETRGSRHHALTTTTPVGPLRIDAVGRYYVDWGDGETTGPYAGTDGEPWPDGQITHMYTSVGVYDVVVTEAWDATWRLGGAGGSLSGQRTTGRIDGFRVEQIQVVVGASGRP